MAKTARARRKRVRGAAVPILPEELVVWEILVRLPAKALLRCRAVCCSWRCLTSSADFLLAHHRRQPSLPLVIFHGKINGSSRKFVDAAVDALDLWGAPTGSERQPVLRFDDYNHYRQFTVHASCDGLLVLSLSNHRFYICNPATRQWTALPKQLIRCKVAALYQHSSSSEHRILYWKRTGFDPDVEYYVFTVGSSVEPRYIGQFKASLEPPLALHSCLHWVVSLSQEMRLLVFNTILESFRYVTIPATDNLGWENVLEMDGMLAISCIRKSQTTLDLWVLQDYDMEVWSLKYQIDLSLAELRSIVSDRMINGLVVSKAGDILVYSVFGDHVSFYCDKKGKLLRKLQWDSVLSTPTTLWFKESLVNHTFFQRQAIARARQPRFFRGL